MYSEKAGLLNSIRYTIYSFHMPLFFVISGYLYHHSYYMGEKPRRKRIFSQVSNLIFVYVLFSIAFGLFKILCAQYTNGDTTFHDILLIGVKAIFPYWYLYVLIIYYLFFSIPLFSNKKAEPFLLAGVIGLCICSRFVPEDTWFQLRYFMYYLPFFYFGFLYSNGLGVFSKVKIVVPAFISAAILFVSFWRAGIPHVIPGDKLLVAFGFVSLIWWLFENVPFFGKCRLFQICGKYALEIYVLHCVFTAGNRVVLPRLGITNIYFNIICNLVISTVIPMAFAVTCKMVGIHDLFFRPASFFEKHVQKINT